MTKALKDHAQWLKEHDAAIREHKSAMKDLDVRMAHFVSGFGEFIRRSEKT